MLFGFYPATSVTSLQPLQAIVETRPGAMFEDAISLQPDYEWKLFMNRLAKPSGYCEHTQVKSVLSFWEGLKGMFGNGAPLPLTLITGEGNIQMAWDMHPLYVEVEVRPDGRLEWFFRDRATGTVDGTEDEPDDSMSEELGVKLLSVLAR